jgi:hypothetical protein
LPVTDRGHANLGVDRYHEVAYLGYPDVAGKLAAAMTTFIIISVLASFMRRMKGEWSTLTVWLRW